MVAVKCYSIMKEASEFDDRDSLTLPANQVLAIANDLEEARGIVEILSQNGFSSEDIGVLTGTEDAKKLEAAIGKKGFIVQAADFRSRHGG